MRAISIETLAGLRGVPNQDAATIRTLDWLINVHCHELQEPWMTLDEFLKSGFRGRCWINFRNERVDFCRFLDGTFFNDGTGFSVRRDFIVKVMPIHKPEPPK